MNTNGLKKIALKIEQKQDSIFSYPVEKQKKYLQHFHEPKDEIERSYFQYCCQMKLYGRPLHFALNLASLPISVIYLVRLKSKNTLPFANHVDAVFLCDGKPINIVPESLFKEFGDIKSISNETGRLSKADISYLKKIFVRYPFSWMFWLKLIIKIAQYSGVIDTYSPNTIISCNEFSYVSSALTNYCHTKDICAINVMHGEKLYYMRDSFVKYDRYYVWDIGYADLLKKLRADSEQFTVEVPKSLIIREDSIKVEYDYTYYLQNETEAELQEVNRELQALVGEGYRISVRPHPRYTDVELAYQVFDNVNVEDCKAIPIEKSILRSKNVISKYSSVLNQAYHSGVGIVIDDVSNKEQYEKLNQLGYVMLAVDHALLSRLIGEKNETVNKKNNEYLLYENSSKKCEKF